MISARTRGWDSTKIPAGNGQPEMDLSTFDVDQGNARTTPDVVGKIPGGVRPSWPDGFDQPLDRLTFDRPAPWRVPGRK